MAIKVVEDSIDNVPEHFRELYSEQNGKFVLTGVEGMKTQQDIDRLMNSLTKERNDHKAVREKYSFLNGLDVAEVQARLDKFPELEAIASGKGVDENAVQKLVEARINSTVAPIKRELDGAKQQLAERESLLQAFQQKEIRRTINDEVLAAIGKNKGFRSEAVEDALLYAAQLFEVTEDGRVVTKDGVGVTPGIEPGVWLTDVQSKKPHWWGQSSGGGASGSGGGLDGSQSNPWSHDGWNVTRQMEIHKENPMRAEQMAKSAGTSLTGGRPVKK